MQFPPIARLVVHDPLMPQLFQKLTDVGADFGGVGGVELRLQLFDDLGEAALAVATLEDLQAGVAQAEGAFGV